jgi:hypothetical protein
MMAAPAQPARGAKPVSDDDMIEARVEALQFADAEMAVRVVVLTG